MMGGLLVAGLLALVLVSAALTGALRVYALRRNVIDQPGARSSHTVPTPRGGGVAIVLCTLGALPVLTGLGLLAPPLAHALLGAGGLVAVVGFIDDHHPLPARWRLLAHFAAAAWALAWLGGAPPIVLGGTAFAPGWWGAPIAAIYLVWLLNLYNFMDGIDGIASAEAISVCVGAAVLWVLTGETHAAVLVLVLSAAVAGFLLWNFPPARIFMGDAGSGFLGMMLGVMSLQAGWHDPALLWAWLILLGVFIVDATLTLLTRWARGDKVYEAHRSHAYQHAARRLGRHLPVTAAVALINLGWLVPIAAWVGTGGLNGLIGVAVSYTPLLLLAWRLRAGRP